MPMKKHANELLTKDWQLTDNYCIFKTLFPCEVQIVLIVYVAI